MPECLGSAVPVAGAHSRRGRPGVPASVASGERAAELLIEAAKGGGVYVVSEKIKKALFLRMRLDVVKTRP